MSSYRATGTITACAEWWSSGECALLCPVGEPAGERCEQGYQRPGTGGHDVTQPRVGLPGGLDDGGGDLFGCDALGDLSGQVPRSAGCHVGVGRRDLLD